MAGPAESTRRGNLQRVGLLFLGSRDSRNGNGVSECRRIYQWTLVHGAKRGQKNKPHVVMDKISDKEVLYGTKSQSVYGKWKNRRRKVVREQKAKPGRHLIFL